MHIPKIIHYCWFGPKPLPELEQKCIESWKKFLPDYELKFWNEESFDVTSSIFVKQAYTKKYYAFVSDYVRAWALKKYGGVYLDTDYELLEDISPIFKKHEGVLGFETSRFVGTAMLAFTPNHNIINEFWVHYQNLSFLSSSGKIQITANPAILADILIKNGFELDGNKQEINKVMIIEREVFFPKKISETEFKTTNNTKGIHHFTGSWLTPRQKRRGQNKFWIEVCRPFLRKTKDFIQEIAGESLTKKLELQIRNWLK